MRQQRLDGRQQAVSDNCGAVVIGQVHRHDVPGLSFDKVAIAERQFDPTMGTQPTHSIRQIRWLLVAFRSLDSGTGYGRSR